MRPVTLPRRRPVASLATVAFLVAFVDLLVVTGLLLSVALAAWVVSLSRS